MNNITESNFNIDISLQHVLWVFNKIVNDRMSQLKGSSKKEKYICRLRVPEVKGII